MENAVTKQKRNFRMLHSGKKALTAHRSTPIVHATAIKLLIQGDAWPRFPKAAL